jgi:PAS domain S-box-containing protein
MDGKLVFVNDTFEIVTGYTKEQLFRDNFIPFVHPDDQERTSQLWQDLFEGKPFENVEYKIINKKGETRWSLSSWKIIKDNNDESIGIFGKQQDITARVLNERELKQQREAANTKNQSKSNFLCNMSHEIRTPLTAIMGFTELLIYFPDLNSNKIKQYLENIHSSSRHLLDLIEEILDFSKIEANAITFEEISVNIKELLAQIFSGISSKAIEKNLDFTLIYLTEIPKVIKIDPTRLRQVLFNLIGNAIKFTEKGFVKIEVSYDNEQENIIIDIIDSGIGIKKSEIKSLFTLYDQLNINISKKYGGTGLGLYLSKKIAERLQGSIELTSTKLNKGSVFRLTFKVKSKIKLEFIKPVNKLMHSIAIKRGSTDLSKLNVLIVEDCEDIVIILKHILDSHNIKNEVASNGLLAIDMARGNKFNLIIMDLQLPSVGGKEAASCIRKNGYNGNIIAMSAFTSDDIVNECISGDFDGFMPKPLDMDCFLDNLVLIIGKLNDKSHLI